MLEGPEETCGALVKCVGSSEEFWTGPHFTSKKEITNSQEVSQYGNCKPFYFHNLMHFQNVGWDLIFFSIDCKIKYNLILFVLPDYCNIKYHLIV